MSSVIVEIRDLMRGEDIDQAVRVIISTTTDDCIAYATWKGSKKAQADFLKKTLTDALVDEHAISRVALVNGIVVGYASWTVHQSAIEEKQLDESKVPNGADPKLLGDCVKFLTRFQASLFGKVGGPFACTYPLERAIWTYFGAERAIPLA